MRFSYYTIDDLRLGRGESGAPLWRTRRFLGWQDAIDHYRRLPASQVKELGLSDGEQTLPLIRCLPLFPEQTEGEDILVAGTLLLPQWREDPVVLEHARDFATLFHVRFCLYAGQLIPKPDGKTAAMEGRYLWGKQPGDCWSAVRWVLVAGCGWISLKEFKRRFPHPGKDFIYPLVLKYRADGVNSAGQFISLEITPLEYKRLERQTLKRRSQNNKTGGKTP